MFEMFEMFRYYISLYSELSNFPKAHPVLFTSPPNSNTRAVRLLVDKKILR